MSVLCNNLDVTPLDRFRIKLLDAIVENYAVLKLKLFINKNISHVTAVYTVDVLGSQT